MELMSLEGLPLQSVLLERRDLHAHRLADICYPSLHSSHASTFFNEEHIWQQMLASAQSQNAFFLRRASKSKPVDPIDGIP